MKEPADQPVSTEKDETGAADPEADEVQSLLGPDVRTPVGIPKQYKPVEASTHSLFKVELAEFAGPLDLLLFLIRKHDVDIFDIPIAFITERYLEMLDDLAALSIDVAAEFLVMAAELTHIKSKMLLPPKEGVAVEDDDAEEVDPRAELVRRLLEYQKYRDAAQDLGDRDLLGRDVFGRIGDKDSVDDEDFDAGFREVTVFRIVEAMADVLGRLEPKKQHEVVADTISIADRIDHIYSMSEAIGPRMSFKDLFMRIESRRVLVITFIAILELARLRAIRVLQELDPDTAEGEEKKPGELVIELLRDRPDEMMSSFDSRLPQKNED